MTNKKSILLAAAMLLSGTKAMAGAMDTLKGCLIIGTSTIGSVALANSQSGVELKDSSTYTWVGLTGCIIGAIISGDLVRKAEMKANEEHQVKNHMLKNEIELYRHEICYREGRCGADGEPYKNGERVNKEDDAGTNFIPLSSGN